MNAKKDTLEKDVDIEEGTSIAAGVAKIQGKKPPATKSLSGDGWFDREQVEVTQDPTSQIEEELNISPGVDPLKAFLEVDTSKPPMAQVRLPRLDTEVTVVAITDSRKHERMIQKCQREYKVRGQRREELDGDMLAKMIVAEYTVWPAFRAGHGADEDNSFKQLSEKYGTRVPDVLVERVLFPGEIQKIADAIMELGGFDTERELAKKL
ncbi:MAG: hypothetical protein OXI63_07295 [Candidatus Poribacteria bacterium]|nr:hypothetical protein [Bacteroidota bacterium]MDE0682701.1 hypothetical protein [Candidatus Poribacteria bacterium]